MAETGWLHHIDITVTDLARSTAFYDRVLPLLGWQRRVDCAEGPIWGGLHHGGTETRRALT